MLNNVKAKDRMGNNPYKNLDGVLDKIKWGVLPHYIVENEYNHHNLMERAWSRSNGTTIENTFVHVYKMFCIAKYEEQPSINIRIQPIGKSILASASFLKLEDKFMLVINDQVRGIKYTNYLDTQQEVANEINEQLKPYVDTLEVTMGNIKEDISERKFPRSEDIAEQIGLKFGIDRELLQKFWYHNEKSKVITVSEEVDGVLQEVKLDLPSALISFRTVVDGIRVWGTVKRKQDGFAEVITGKEDLPDTETDLFDDVSVIEPQNILPTLEKFLGK